jgi:hypothetical protein
MTDSRNTSAPTDLVEPAEIDRLRHWGSGSAARLALKKKLPSHRDADGKLLMSVSEVEKAIASMGPY